MVFGDKDLYIAKKVGIELNDYGEETPIFGKPKYYRFSYMPTSGQVDYQVYGTLINNMFTAYLPISYLGQIKSGDMAYLIDENNQDVEELSYKDRNNKYCENANYRVRLAQPQNMRLKVLFEKV